MAKLKISDYSSTSAGANLNTDINSIDIDEGCAPSGINNAIRTLMAQLKDFQTGVSGDSLTLGGALSGTSATFSGNVTASAISGASMTLSGDLTVDTNTLYVDSTNSAVGIGTTSPAFKLEVVGGTNNGIHIKDAESATVYGGLFTSATPSLYLVARSNHPLNFGTNDTERMRIDSSGNVGIGTTSMAGKLTIQGASSTNPNTVVSYGYIANGAVDTRAGTIRNNFDTNTDYGTYWTSFRGANGASYKAIFGVRSAGTDTDAITIENNGNVGIGTSSPAQKLQVSSAGDNVVLSTGGSGNAGYIAANGNGRTNLTGAFILLSYSNGTAELNNSSNANMLFKTNNTEQMRIDSSGNVGIGTTNPTAKLVAEAAAGTTPVLIVSNSSTSGNVSGTLNVLNTTGNNTSSYHFAGLTQGISFWYLYGNGTSSWTSDQRKKKNIETTRDGYVEDLCKLRVVKYNWINQDDNEPKELGLIAQEVEQVFPGLIQDALHEDDDGIKYKTIKGSVLPYMLLKAIQELKTENDTLKSQLSALETRIQTLENQ